MQVGLTIQRSNPCYDRLDHDGPCILKIEKKNPIWENGMVTIQLVTRKMGSYDKTEYNTSNTPGKGQKDGCDQAV